jgi:hypothetical protein
MAVTSGAPVQATTASALPRHRPVPIKPWAIFGAFWLALYAYVVVSWLSGPDTQRVPGGPDPLPAWQQTLFDIYVPCGIVAGVFCVYWFIVRPLIRERRWTSDSLLFIVVLILVLQDPLGNYFQPTFTYNSYLWNAGSWVRSIPGWQSISAGKPGAMQAYPLLFLAPVYAYMVFPVTLFCTWVMKKLRGRWPTISNIRLIFCTFMVGFVFDFVTELPWMHLGFYNFWSTWPALTVSYGHYYQFPIYEAVGMSIWWTSFACLRFYRNDRGETYVERGVNELRIPAPAKTLARFLALLASGSTLYLVLYNVPIQFVSLLTKPAWINDAQQRSYFMNGI